MKPKKEFLTRVIILGLIIGLTLSIHYGWVLEPVFGHAAWVHAVHGRFCYIPITIAAAWFGLRGGLFAAGTISILILPLILSDSDHSHGAVDNWVEIVFYFGIATLVGGVVDRETRARRRQQLAEIQVIQSQKLSLAGQIAAGVAHEIKNPLASIKGAAEILCDPGTSESEREDFREILTQEIRRIDDTVRDFLDFAHPRQAEKTRLNLSELAEACVKQIMKQVGDASLTIATRIESGIVVVGERERLQQLLLNLLLNAIDASPPGKQVRVVLESESEGDVRLTIGDQGTGIESSDLNRIFDPFFTTKDAGAGMGLAVAKSIVDSHGGRILVSSDRNRGTEFAVILGRRN